MSNWAESAYSPAATIYKETVIENTWGHLAPKKNTSYKGKILFCVSGYGYTGTAIIDSKFENLEDSSWLYDAMDNYINNWTIEEDGVYLINCTFRNYRFYGTPKKVYGL